MIFLTLFALVTLLMVVGMPVALAMGLSALVVVLMKGDINPIVMAQRMFVGVDSLPLLAIPYFILAGGLMEVGASLSVSQRPSGSSSAGICVVPV